MIDKLRNFQVEQNCSLRETLSPRVINLQHLAQYTSGDRSLELEILGLFHSQAILQFENIGAAVSETDWIMAVHTLKGSARSIGAQEVAELSANLENIGFAGDRVDLATEMAQLQSAVALCVVTIEVLLKAG